MEKSNEKKGLKIMIYLFVIFALVHGFIHVALFQTNLSLIKTVGLSGYAIGSNDATDVESNIKKSPVANSASIRSLASESIIILSLIVLSVLKLKKTDTEEEKIKMVTKTNKSQTDIDLLYELLQKNKKISVTKVMKLLKVDKDVVLQWGEVLENNGLAVVDYPRFGEIEIRLKENDKKE